MWGRMDTLARLIVIVVALLVLVAVDDVHAYGAAKKTPTESYTGSCGSLNIHGLSPTDAAAACLGPMTKTNPTPYPYDCPWSEVGVIDAVGTESAEHVVTVTFAVMRTYGGGGPDCPAHSEKRGAPYSAGLQGVIDATCSPGSQPVGARCECGLGMKPGPGGTCVRHSCFAPGAYSVVTQPDVVVANVGPICMDGCSVNPSTVKASIDGTLYATWPYVSTGQFCGGPPPFDSSPVSTGNDSNPAPAQCPANQCPGSVNGASVCVPCKNTSAPSAAASSSQSGNPNAPGGAAPTDTTSSTTCDGLKCTTTTITRDSAGAVVGTKTEDKPQPSFCKDNPESPLCKKSGFGGSCGAYTCDGDAIQCAIAERIHKSACELENQDAALVAAGNAAIGGGLRPDGHPANDPEVRSIAFGTVIDQSDPIGGGCPVDQPVAVGPVTVVIPWSKACTSLQMLGTIVTAFSMLAAAFVVFRS